MRITALIVGILKTKQLSKMLQLFCVSQSSLLCSVPIQAIFDPKIIFFSGIVIT